MAPLVIGLTGQFGAGCTTVAEYLEKEHNFKRYSFSTVIKPAAKQRLGKKDYAKLNPKERRRVLQDQGNILREPNPANIAKSVREQIKAKHDEAKDIVIEAFRNPFEIHAFREKFGDSFFLLAIDAPIQARFKRNYDDYGDDLEQFKRDDLRDKGEDEPKHGQQTEKCVYLADISINNHGEIKSATEWDKFFARFEDRYLKLIRILGIRRPTYQELYMRQAYASSLKSSCTKRQVGALIVSERRQNEEAVTKAKNKAKAQAKEVEEAKESFVIAAGFNDVPIGEYECREKGSTDDPLFCPKDDEEEKKLRAMKYCPSCRRKLSLPDGKIRNYICPKCNARLPRDFIPGRLLDTCRAVHAEEAAILQAARLGSTALMNAALYTTTFPCLLCAKSIINSGISTVVYHKPYPMDDTMNMLNKCEITLQKYEGVSAWSFDRMFRKPSD